MRKLLLFIVILATLALAGGSWSDGSAKAATDCIRQNGVCMHWGDSVRASEQNVQHRIYGAWGQGLGVDGSTYRQAIGETGCAPGGGVFNVFCGESTIANPYVTAASYLPGGCAAGNPTSPPFTGVRGVTTCISNYNQPCGASQADKWAGCTWTFWGYEWRNGAWYQSEHIAEAAVFLDSTLFLQTNGVVNYGAPYHQRLATKKELVCHEEAHGFGLNHADAFSCMNNRPLCDQGNPEAVHNYCVQYLYEAAGRLNAEGNHNDPWQPNAMSTAVADKLTMKANAGVDLLALRQASRPHEFYGKAGVKVVQTATAPKGLPQRNVIYIGKPMVHSTPTSKMVKKSHSITNTGWFCPVLGQTANAGGGYSYVCWSYRWFLVHRENG
jgi:hypothetical protein